MQSLLLLLLPLALLPMEATVAYGKKIHLWNRTIIDEAWQSSTPGTGCFHERSQEIRSTVGKAPYHSMRVSDTDDFVWLAIQLAKSYIVTAVHIVTPNGTIMGYEFKMTNIEVWTSASTFNFGDEHCKLKNMSSIFERNRTQWTQCGITKSGNVTVGETLNVNCIAEVRTLLLRKKAAWDDGSYGQLIITDIYISTASLTGDVKIVNETVDAAWQSSVSRAGCVSDILAEKRNSGWLLYHSDNKSSAVNGYHWLAIQLKQLHIVTAAHIMTRIDQESKDEADRMTNIEVWTSESAFDFGSDHCNSTNISSVFEQNSHENWRHCGNTNSSGVALLEILNVNCFAEVRTLLLRRDVSNATQTKIAYTIFADISISTATLNMSVQPRATVSTGESFNISCSDDSLDVTGRVCRPADSNCLNQSFISKNATAAHAGTYRCEFSRLGDERILRMHRNATLTVLYPPVSAMIDISEMVCTSELLRNVTLNFETSAALPAPEHRCSLKMRGNDTNVTPELSLTQRSNSSDGSLTSDWQVVGVSESVILHSVEFICSAQQPESADGVSLLFHREKVCKIAWNCSAGSAGSVGTVDTVDTVGTVISGGTAVTSGTVGSAGSVVTVTDYSASVTPPPSVPFPVMWIIIVSAAAVVTILLASMLIVVCRRRRNRQNFANKNANGSCEETLAQDGQPVYCRLSTLPGARAVSTKRDSEGNEYLEIVADADFLPEPTDETSPVKNDDNNALKEEAL